MNVFHKFYDFYKLKAAPRSSAVPTPAPEQPPFIASILHGSGVTPYLGLRSRLSQVWINRWTILLFLVLVRTLIATASIEDGIQQAKASALSSCSAVESIGSTMASAPHYMAQGVNSLTAKGVDKAVAALWDMMMMIVSGIEELVVFYINMLTSTYMCLITFVIAGSLHAAIALIEDAQGFLNQTLGDISKDIHSGINDFESGVNNMVNDMDKVGKFFGSKTSIPTLNIPNDSLNKLDNVTLPGNLDADLQKLNGSIPTFAQVQNFTDNAIRLPFEEIKKLLNGTNHNYTLDRTVLPVPDKQQLTFCSDNDGINNFFKGLLAIEITARTVAIAVLVVLAVLVCIPMAYRELRRWRLAESSALLAEQQAFDTMDTIYIGSRPYTALAGIKAGGVSKSYQRQTVIRWLIAYVTSEPAMFLLSLATAGFFTCLCHYLVLRVVVQEAPKLAEEVGGFADKVADAMQNASVQWANGTNTEILKMNDKINHDVFGWVNISTTALNKTINVFADEMTDALNATFGGTVLYEPVTEVFNCLIGLKLQSIEKGLTWVQDHAHIDFPLLPNDTLSMDGLANSSGNPQAQALVNGPNDDVGSSITGALMKLVAKVEKQILVEIIISCALLGAWVLMALGGACRALWLMFSKRGQESSRVFANNRPIIDRDPPNAEIPEKRSVSADSFGDEDPVTTLPPVFREKSEPPPVPMPMPPQQARFAPADSADNTGSRFNGQDYTLRPRPFQPSTTTASDERMGSVGGGQVAGSVMSGSGRKSMIARKSVAPPGQQSRPNAPNGTFQGLGF